MKQEGLKPPKAPMLISLKVCLSLVIAFLSLLLITSLFICDYFLITRLYKAVQVNYITKKSIEPTIDRNANLTKALIIRIKAVHDILLESRLRNMQFLIAFTNEYFDSKKDPINQVEYRIGYYSLTSNEDTTDPKHHIRNKNMFNLMTYFFPVFQMNFNKGIDIQEFIIIDTVTKNYFTYCYDIKNEYIFFEELSKNSDVLDLVKNTVREHGFADFVVKNPYQTKSYLNYLKFISFEQAYGTGDNKGGPYEFIMAIRLKAHSFKKMFNTQRTNMTTVLYQYDFTQSTKAKLHYVTSSDFLDYFYQYAMKNMLDYSTIQYQTEFDEEINYINTKLDTFFKLLSNESQRGETYYKLNWEKELIIISKIFYSILHQYNETVEPNVFLDKDCEAPKNKLICEAEKGIDFFSFNLSKYTANSSLNKKETDVLLSDFFHFVDSANVLCQKLKYGDSKILIENNVFKSDVYLAPTKILLYNQSINNLQAVNIEIIDTGLYSDSTERFISEMTSNKQMMVWLLLGFSIAALAIALVIGQLELNAALGRLKKISQLKTDFFMCKFSSKREGNNSHGRTDHPLIRSRTALDNNRKDKDNDDDDKARWREDNIYKDEFFKENNKMIINRAYDHLTSKLELLSTCHDKRFTEKLQFLSQKFRLNDGKKGKEDCELASSIYTSISMVDYINFKDISYNVHYNYSAILNKEFNCLKTLLENVSNNDNKPLKKSKFVSLEEITQILYHTKREKIQSYINAMMDKD